MWEIISSRVTVAEVLITLSIISSFVGLFSLAIKYLKTKKQLESLQTNLKSQSDKILEEATKRAYQITEEANLNAQKIIEKAELFSNDGKMAFEEELRSVSKKYQEAYRVTLEELQLATKSLIQGMSLGANEGLKQALKNFEETLNGEVMKSQKDRAVALELLYKKALEETENFKKERFGQIDTKMLEIIKEITKKILAREITSEEHEQMVLESLKKAKEENVF